MLVPNFAKSKSWKHKNIKCLNCNQTKIYKHVEQNNKAHVYQNIGVIFVVRNWTKSPRHLTFIHRLKTRTPVGPFIGLPLSFRIVPHRFHFHHFPSELQSTLDSFLPQKWGGKSVNIWGVQIEGCFCYFHCNVNEDADQFITVLSRAFFISLHLIFDLSHILLHIYFIKHCFLNNICEKARWNSTQNRFLLYSSFSPFFSLLKPFRASIFFPVFLPP